MKLGDLRTYLKSLDVFSTFLGPGSSASSCILSGVNEMSNTCSKNKILQIYRKLRIQQRPFNDFTNKTIYQWTID